MDKELKTATDNLAQAYRRFIEANAKYNTLINQRSGLDYQIKWIKAKAVRVGEP